MPKLRGAVLSGQLNYRLEGGEIPARARVPLGYVAQETAFFSNLTVWETVLLAAKLRSGASDAPDYPDTQAYSLLSRLGLLDCMHTRVGGDTGGKMVTGISGGEKKRLSIACELAGKDATEPSILVADEPTSGLDAFQADLMVAKLKELAVTTRSIVICSLHQPRSASMERVDDLLLMAPCGRVAYAAPLAACVDYFLKLGHRCPPQHSLAEFLVDLVSVDNSSDATRQASRERIDLLVKTWAEHSRQKLKLGARGPAVEPQVPANGAELGAEAEGHLRQRGRSGFLRTFGREFRLLFGRVVKQTRRDLWNHAARGAASVALGCAYGATNFALGRSQASIKKRASMMFQLCITTSMMSIVKTLNSFPRERVTVKREMERGGGGGRGGYSPGAYMLSKMLVETPVDAFFPVLFGLTLAPLARLNRRRIGHFLAVVCAQSMAASGIGMTIGSVCPTVDTALAIGPALMVVSIMVADESGMFAEIPGFMKPLSKSSVVKWGFQGTMAAEMAGLTFDVDDSALPKALREAPGPAGEAQRRAAEGICLTSGEQVLQELGFGGPAVKGALCATGAIYTLNAAVSFLAMQCHQRYSRGGARLSGNML